MSFERLASGRIIMNHNQTIAINPIVWPQHNQTIVLQPKVWPQHNQTLVRR